MAIGMFIYGFLMGVGFSVVVYQVSKPGWWMQHQEAPDDR